MAPLPPEETTRPQLLVGNHAKAIAPDERRGHIVNPEEVKDA